jgi:DNA adenine methylase
MTDLDHLYAVATRLKTVQLECADGRECITRFDGPKTLFYIDPPYLHGTRYENSKQKGYKHEMTDEDHRALAAQLNAIQGMAIVSGYRSDLYDELYPGWNRVEKQSRDINGKNQVECLWLSPSVQTALNEKRKAAAQPASLPMFA